MHGQDRLPNGYTQTVPCRTETNTQDDARMLHYIKQYVRVLFEEDPVDKWVADVCKSVDIDCTITRWKLFFTVAAAIVSIIIYCLIARLHAGWEVRYGEPFQVHGVLIQTIGRPSLSAGTSQKG